MHDFDTDLQRRIKYLFHSRSKIEEEGMLEKHVVKTPYTTDPRIQALPNVLESHYPTSKWTMEIILPVKEFQTDGNKQKGKFKLV